ncbi:MAG: glycosyltransferase family 4 protein, partial [Gammaproteobacteria bacterium]|nr:glycosyltransferase family 4 protein [Gammaproteobacteria bacterium]
ITYLLQAMPRVIDLIPDITLVIAGDGNIKSKLIAESEALGINNNVLFVGPRMDMARLLKLFDVYVLPSLWEGLPMVLLEAMAAGCPIIATNVGGNSMVITHHENGSLIEPCNPELLSDEIINVIRDNKLRCEYVVRSKEKFKNYYSAENMTKKYMQLYLKK